MDHGGGATWENSKIPAECPHVPPQESYCYPEPEQIPLSIVMGSHGNQISEVSDLSQYVEALYDWMLYAGMIIAVVMVMIGWVEYTISGGDKNRTDRAKKRFIGAAAGLALLLSAYTILATVNPKIVLMEIPQLPMVKSIAYLEEGMQCSWLVDKGYVVEAEGYTFCDKNKSKHTGTCTPVTNVNCGVRGEIIAGPEGGDATADFCYFSHCP